MFYPKLGAGVHGEYIYEPADEDKLEKGAQQYQISTPMYAANNTSPDLYSAPLQILLLKAIQETKVPNGLYCSEQIEQ